MIKESETKQAQHKARLCVLSVCILASAIFLGCSGEENRQVETDPTALTKALPIEKQMARPFVYIPASNSYLVPYARARYNPYGKSIRGIPVGDIDSNWCKANEFERKMFPTELLKIDGEDVLGEGAFAITGQVDGGRDYSALVGAFETCKGDTGFFLLVLDTVEKEKPEVMFLEKFNETQGLLYLQKSDPETFLLWWCDRCGDYQELQWNKENQKFSWNEIEWK